MKFGIYTYIVLFICNFLVSNIVTEECNTPAECYIRATAILKQDREEMRNQLEQYQKMYMEVIKENINLKETVNDMEAKLNAKISEVTQGLQNQINQMKTYLERPFQSIYTILYESNYLSTNLSAISLIGKIPNIAKRILVYAGFQSGNGYESHGYINFYSKVSGNMIKRILKFDGYNQNAYNSNSSVFEMDLDGVDMNLYFESEVNYRNAIFNFSIILLGYK